MTLTWRQVRYLSRYSGDIPMITLLGSNRRLCDGMTRRETLKVGALSLLGGAFSGLALMLAAVGLYGVIAYAIVRRRSEISLRLALGATPPRIVGMVLRDHAALLVAGISLGCLLATLGSRLVASRLYGVSAGDPREYMSAIASLVAVAAVATLVPAWRASRMDPAETLR